MEAVTNIDTLVQWLTAMALILSLGNTVVIFLKSGSKENAKKLDAVRDAIEDHDRRIQKIETEMEHLPDKDQVNDLKLALTELKGTVGTLNESLGSVQRTVLRIDDYLRQEKVS